MTSGFIPTLKQPFARLELRTRQSSSHMRTVLAARRLKAACSTEGETDSSRVMLPTPEI